MFMATSFPIVLGRLGFFQKHEAVFDVWFDALNGNILKAFLYEIIFQTIRSLHLFQCEVKCISYEKHCRV